MQLHWTVSQLGTVLDPAHKTSLHGQVRLILKARYEALNSSHRLGKIDLRLISLTVSQVEVKCFNYKKVTLGYGPDFAYHVNVGFSANQRQFVVTFGSRGGAGFNGHVLLAPFYLALFNSTKSLPLLAKTLVVSSGPLQALVKLSQVLASFPRLSLISHPNCILYRHHLTSVFLMMKFDIPTFAGKS